MVDLKATKAQQVAFWDFALNQVGKPYDTTAIWAFALGRSRDWREDDSWFCSELISCALEQAGIIKSLYYGASKVTPAELLMICTALGAVANGQKKKH